MSMERGGFGNVARSASFVERVYLAAVCASDCWAGAAAAAAGCGLLGSTDLLASALRTSVAMVGLFDIEVMKKDQVVLLLHAGKIWVFSEVPSRGRAGCACCCSSLRACRSRMAGACVGSMRLREQPVHMWNAWTFCLCAHAVLAVLQYASDVRACCVEGAGQCAADGHARRERANRTRGSGAPPGAAQSAAPIGSRMFPKSRFTGPSTLSTLPSGADLAPSLDSTLQPARGCE